MARNRPLAAAISISREIDEIFERFFGSEPAGAIWEPGIELFTDDAAVYIMVEIPGVTADHLGLTVSSRWVHIRGVKPVPDQVRRGVSFYEAEIPYGPFEKRVSLPYPVDPDTIQVELKHGVLSMKMERAGTSPRTVKVE